MIVGIGTDLAEVDRIERSVKRFGQRFLHRIYTTGEQQYCFAKANVYERLAARFAAKEAGMKAIGTGWNHGVRWLDFEVSNERSGRPVLKLQGKALEFAQRLGTQRVTISLTHTANLSFAVVILEA